MHTPYIISFAYDRMLQTPPCKQVNLLHYIIILNFTPKNPKRTVCQG